MQPYYVSLDTADENNIEYWHQLGFIENKPRVVNDDEQIIFLSNGISDIHLHLHKACAKTGVRYLCLRVNMLEGECEMDELGRYQDKVDYEGFMVRIREVPPKAPEGKLIFSE